MKLRRHKVLLMLSLAFAALMPAAAVAPPAPVLACFAPEPEEVQAEPETTLDAVQQALVDHLARRYQIAPEPTGRIVETAYRAAELMQLDPLLVLAVISVESRFNPIAESNMGARGLMQIIPKWHREKLAAHGGDEAVLDPASNILVGTQILREYVRRTGSLEAGLQYYNGASWDDSARYTQRVMAERQRLQVAARAAKRTGI
jgi:soluble lytic murein transglycosylase-like protein